METKKPARSKRLAGTFLLFDTIKVVGFQQGLFAFNDPLCMQGSTQICQQGEFCGQNAYRCKECYYDFLGFNCSALVIQCDTNFCSGNGHGTCNTGAQTFYCVCDGGTSCPPYPA